MFKTFKLRLMCGNVIKGNVSDFYLPTLSSCSKFYVLLKNSIIACVKNQATAKVPIKNVRVALEVVAN